MQAKEIERLRADLGCSVGELANAIGVEVKAVLKWESGDLFPTKKHVEKLLALRDRGPSAIVRKPRGKAAKTGVALLADPALWGIVRKLVAHPDFFAEVSKLSDRYEDPVSSTA